MRRFAPSISVVLFVYALLGGADSPVCAQSSKTAPLPISPVSRIRLFPKQRDEQQPPPEAQPKSSIPLTPPAQPLAQPPNPPAPGGFVDPVLVQVKQAIDLNKRRLLDPQWGHTPWMIMHGVLALRQEYQLTVGNQKINALEYITQQNPLYVGTLNNPLNPGAPPVQIRNHWFQSTAYGGRAQPYIVSFAFEGHTNQFLAILSMSDLPLTQTFVVSDSQKPGATKIITMADMVRHAQMNVHVGNPNEIAWTLWFLSNYLAPDEKWVDKDGNPWSMEQLVTIQTNAPLFDGPKLLAPCGGTHGLFALASACNSYEQKFGKLDGAWHSARMKLNERIAQAKGMQNRDGSFSTDYFRNTGWSNEMGPRFKSSGHMLEWLMMALPPEDLKESWVRSGVKSVAIDLVRNGNVGLGTADTGAMYHALHALVLYRNRVEPPASNVPPEQVAEVPPELKNPAPGTIPTPPMPVPPNPDKGTAPQPSAVKPPEATIRLINPPNGKLIPLGSARPILRPITNSKGTESDPRPAPPPLAERIVEPKSGDPARVPLLLPTQPELEKPTPTRKPTPAPSEPKSEGAIVKPLTPDEGDTSAVPLFGDDPEDMKAQPAPAPRVPSLPEPTPAKSPSSSD